MIVRFQIPIPNYENNGVFEKHIYIECDLCPSVEQLKAVLKAEDTKDKQMAAEYPEYGPYLHEYEACLKVLDGIKNDEWVHVQERGVVRSSIFVETKFGKQSLSADIINPIKI